ncbi:MAG: shikimate kinase, partial [Deltaproteobacteria bacterium]|nr:shikimate kinase [Candidatus Tharpella sp.]
VWLQASSEIIRERLDHDPQSQVSRPPLSSLGRVDEILIGLKEREPLYREVADFVISVDRQSRDEIVQRIINILAVEKGEP